MIRAKRWGANTYRAAQNIYNRVQSVSFGGGTTLEESPSQGGDPHPRLVSASWCRRSKTPARPQRGLADESKDVAWGGYHQTRLYYP